MQGHKFEDDVNKHLEELALRPTEGVWNRVEVTLRKDRKRRGLLFLLPLLILIGLGGYKWIQHAGIVSEAADIKNQDTGIMKPPDGTVEYSKLGAGTPKQQIDSLGKSIGQQNSKPSKNEPGKSIPAATISTTSGSFGDKKTKTSKNILPVTVQTSAIKKKPEAVPNQQVTIIAGIKTNLPSGELLIKSESETILSPEQKYKYAEKGNDSISTTLAIVKKDSMAAGKAPVLSLLNKGNENFSPEKKLPDNRPKWKWGIAAGAGLARVGEGGLLHAFDKSLVMDVAAYNGSGQTPASANNTASAITPGSSWSAGVFIQHTLVKRVQFSVGLQYNYFSAHHAIGSRVDSSRIISNGYSNSFRVLDFYRNGSEDKYTSNYHFLELPISLHIQLNKNQRTPLIWNNGLSVGQLLSTNGLHYDGSSGVYYKDENLFRKTQFGLHTGLSLKLFTKAYHPVELGPQFHYKFSNLLIQKNDGNRHLLSGSLIVRWYINK